MKNEINFFAETTFRNIRKKFGVKTDDRRRHIYVFGKTGMGKTAMIQNMAIQDIKNGKGVGFVDPHGEAAEALLDYIPQKRINDVIYFNPADLDYPVAFNVMEKVDLEHRHLVASGLMGVFKKIWPDVWSARMEYILNNTILALLEYPGSTLLGVNRMFSDPDFRRRVVEKITDPIVKSFWITEFARYSQSYEVEATAAIQNKVGQFISAPLIRNIIGQVQSAINMREVMDKGKILIANISKGRVGEDNSRLLGALLITKLQLAAMSRVDIPEEKRRDFYLYVDEFQNFATEAFVNILSEARKYRLNLILANQYLAQLEEMTPTGKSSRVKDAVFGNIGTIISFRIGAEDAEYLEKEFSPEFTAQDLVNLAKYQVYLKLMIDGLAGRPFSAGTLPPFPSPLESSREKIIKASRERYGTSRNKVEEAINKWSGFLQMLTMPLPKKQSILYDAKCSLCQKPTKVIFPPDGTRPVYCKSCLKKVRNRESTPDRESNLNRESNLDREQLPPSPKEEIPKMSLEEAVGKEVVFFGGKLKKYSPFPEKRKKRKEVNLEELKKVLHESLNNFKKPDEQNNQQLRKTQ